MPRSAMFWQHKFLVEIEGQSPSSVLITSFMLIHEWGFSGIVPAVGLATALCAPACCPPAAPTSSSVACQGHVPPIRRRAEAWAELLVGGTTWTAWRDERSGRFYYQEEGGTGTPWGDPRILGHTVSLHAAVSKWPLYILKVSPLPRNAFVHLH